ncbi:MAG: ATP-binding protein [Thermodesulfobacteriota bacterium]
MQVLEENERGFSAVLFSSLEEIDGVEQKAYFFLLDQGLAVDVFGVRLLLRESLLNSIRHGHSFDRNKKIRFSLRREADHLALCIEDEGPGFDYRLALREGLMPQGRTGRGLTILRAYADEVAYSGRGNVLSLKIRLGTAGEEGPASGTGS